MPADQLDKIARILARLDEAEKPDNMDLPGFRLHPLKGDLKGFWSVSVSGNWTPATAPSYSRTRATLARCLQVALS